MSATQKFYTGFALAVAIVVAISFAAGYRHGYHAGADSIRALHRAASHAAP